MKRIITLLPLLWIVAVMVLPKTVAAQTTIEPLTQTMYQSFETIENSRHFENGDAYYHKRISYNENKETNHVEQIDIYGNDIVIRYIDQATKEKVVTSDFTNIGNHVLMISTDYESYLIGVPAVYKADTTANTLSILREKEMPIVIKQYNGKYTVTFHFPHDVNTISEYWYLKSYESMNYFTDENTLDCFMFHDLANGVRVGIDGYYFQTPYNYVPGGEGVLYLHPSCLAGISLAKFGVTPFAKNLGYAMLDVHLKNQNEYGFWETGPRSQWLSTDFGFGSGFYDTRFNSDLVYSLAVLYMRDENPIYYDAVMKYMDFFEMLIRDYSYETKSGGFFVADYYYTNSPEKTHSSLNHTLTEINVLLTVYQMTNDEKYLNYANQMILAIEDTRDLWVLADGNLKYELYYTKNTNLMLDYVYLTYNDMYALQNTLLTVFGERNQTIDYLMASKRSWLIANNHLDYRQ